MCDTASGILTRAMHNQAMPFDERFHGLVHCLEGEGVEDTFLTRFLAQIRRLRTAFSSRIAGMTENPTYRSTRAASS